MSVFNGIQHGLSNVNNLHPHPPSARVAADSKLKKVNTQQESIHSLRLLHNRFLQWRFSNAKAEAAMVAQTQAAERMLYSLGIKISDLRESVMRRQIELGLLRRSKILFSILESQADVKVFREALSSALKVMEMIESQISSFMPKAAEMDKLLSELARVNSAERNYIEESGDLLSKANMLQLHSSANPTEAEKTWLNTEETIDITNQATPRSSHAYYQLSNLRNCTYTTTHDRLAEPGKYLFYTAAALWLVSLCVKMGMKFLNKKGWHTGSLRNIENVWKAEQKHEQEQKKLEELRKQIVEERERAEFRQLQEQAGLVPRQERLDFLYDSGLAVGKSSEGFKSLEAYPKPEESATVASSSAAEPQSANDAWRKLHSDPLLMIRQREQEALARIRNNPVKMAMIRRTVEEESRTRIVLETKRRKESMVKRKSSHKKHSSRSRRSDDDDDDNEDSRKGATTKIESAKTDNHYTSEKPGSDSEEELKERGRQRKNDNRESRGKDNYAKGSRQYRNARRGSDSEEDVRERESQRKDDRGRSRDNYDKPSRHYRDVRRVSDLKEEVRTRDERMDDRESRGKDDRDQERKQFRDVRRGSDDSREMDHHKDSRNRHDQSDDRETRNSDVKKSIHDKYPSHSRSDYTRQEKESRNSAVPASNGSSAQGPDHNPQNRRKKAPKLSEEERAARLHEMQLDAEVHEEQRWKRLKKAEEEDAREVALAAVAKGKNFLEVAKKNVYGAEQGGSATIEESVRRRSHYLQGRSAADAGNAFRR
ncbi:unnamed protein product [Rhodiola kirilowii]